MAELIVLGPIIFNGIISVPLGFGLWKGFWRARTLAIFYGLLWLAWGAFLFPFGIPAIGYGIAAAYYLTRERIRDYFSWK